jgi:hypothetical protein
MINTDDIVKQLRERRAWRDENGRPVKAKHTFALLLEVQNVETGETHTAGLLTAGPYVDQVIWAYDSAQQGHSYFDSVQPGDWHNRPKHEPILGVTLVREDGKVWSKAI